MRRDSEKKREKEKFYSTLMPEILPGCLFPFSSRFHSHVFSVDIASGVRLPVCLCGAFLSIYIRIEVQFVHTHIWLHSTHTHTYTHIHTHTFTLNLLSSEMAAGGVLQCVAMCCSVLQCVAVCCSVLQCVAVCCSVLHIWQ